MDKHLKVVREAVWDVRAKWYHLGVELGVEVETLDVSSCNTLYDYESVAFCITIGHPTESSQCYQCLFHLTPGDMADPDSSPNIELANRSTQVPCH